MPPKLNKVIRLDSIPLEKAKFTPEGYLEDKPILTSIGIFEYYNSDGSIRRELRLPEEVFKAESLETYKGKPIIITHDAGLINKDNVADEQIGTILTNGYRAGDDVRAEIIIHETDKLKRCGLKELSLGYNLDLEETPGEWNGQHYDAIQRNIVVNHLAIVREARAGDQARLNLDSRNSTQNILKGGRKMKKTTKKVNSDSVLTDEEFKQAIEEYKKRRAQKAEGNKDEELDPKKDTPEVTVATDAEDNPAEGGIEAQMQEIKDRRDEEQNPETAEEAKKIIDRQDEDIEKLFDIIDTLLAKVAFDEACGGNPDDKADADGCGKNCDGDGEEEDPEMKVSPALGTDGCGKKCDEEDPEGEVMAKKEMAMNADSIDMMIRDRIRIGVLAEKLNLDGLDTMNITAAKKAIVAACKPSMRLDGKSSAYINAAFDLAEGELKNSMRKDTAFQKRQMFNKDSRGTEKVPTESAVSARQRMIERQQNAK